MKIEKSAENWNPFPLATWVAWMAATVVAAMTMVAYAHSTFETKEGAREREGTVVQRLDRIELKVDRVLERPHSGSAD